MSSECELLFDINAETDLFIRCKTVRHLVPAGIEPATLSVWRTRDNHYTKEPCHWRGKYCRPHLDWEHQDEKGLVAQRITRLTTDQKIAGSNPAEIGILFNFLEEKTNCVWMKHKKKNTLIQPRSNRWCIATSKRYERPRVGSNHQPFG